MPPRRQWVRIALSGGLKGNPSQFRLEAINATNVATNRPGHGCCRWQAVWGMSRRQVELPLRAAIEYLAGRIVQAEFEHWASTDSLQQLRQNLELGNRIVEVSIASRLIGMMTVL